MIRPFSRGSSIFIVSLKFFNIGRKFLYHFVTQVFAQNLVLKIHSFKDTFPVFMSQKKITD